MMNSVPGPAAGESAHNTPPGRPGKLRCPDCHAQLRAESRMFGLVRRYPQRCHRCGVRLGYDLAGGIRALPD